MKPFSRNILSLSSAELVSRFLGFLAVAYLARTLGPAGLGILAVGMAILSYATIFAEAGLPLVGTRRVAGEGTVPRSLPRGVITARMILSVTVLILAAVIIQLTVKDAITRGVATVYLVSLVPSALLLDWLFQGLERMVTLSVGRIVAMMIYLLWVVAFVSESDHLVRVPIGWMVGMGAHAAYLGFTYRKLTRDLEASEPDNQGPTDLIRAGLPLGLANLMAQVVIQFPFLYLGFIVSKEDAGLYSVAYRGIVLMLILDRVFYTLFFPSIRKSFARGLEHLKKRFEQTLKLVATGGFYLGILAILAADAVFPFVFGTEFVQSALIFQLLVAYFVLSLINSVFTFSLIASENEVAYTRSLAAGTLGFFAIILLPLPVEATLQAPVALTVFQIVSLMAMLKRIRNIIPVDALRPVALPLLASIVLVGLLSAWQRQAGLIPLVLAIAAGLPIVGWSAGVKREDILELKRILV